MSRIAIDSANASGTGIGIPPATAAMPSQSQPAPTAIAAAAPRSTIPTSATPLQKQQFKNQIISPNRANAAVALSALFRSEPAPAEVANASAIVAQQVCLPSFVQPVLLRASFFELDTHAIFAEFYWPEHGMCLFFVLRGYPTNKSRDARLLEANCKDISNGQQRAIHFHFSSHSICRDCSSHLDIARPRPRKSHSSSRTRHSRNSSPAKERP